MRENKNDFFCNKKENAQTLFPIFPEDSRFINSGIAVKMINSEVYYFNGEMPIYHHHKADYKSFRYITSQMIELGNIKQGEVIRAFKVSKESVKRWVKTYRTEGASGFLKAERVKKEAMY